MKKDVWDPTRRDMKIATKMVLIFGGVVVITSVLVACISLALFNHGLLNSYAEGLDYTEYGTNATLESWRSSAQGISKGLAAESGLVSAVNSRDTHVISRIVSEMNRIHEADFMAVTDSKGDIFSGASVNVNGGKSLARLDCVKEALAGRSSFSVEQIGNIDYAIVTADPLTLNGKAVGAAVSGFNLTTNRLVQLVHDSYDAECTVFKNNIRVATTLKEKDGKSLVGTPLDNKVILDMVLGGKTYKGQNIIHGKKYYTIYTPIKSANGTVTGMLFVAKSIESINAIRNKTLRIVVPSVIALIIIVMVLCGMFVRWLMWRISNVTNVLKDLETGEADLTKRVKLLIRDEIGFLIIHFDHFCDKLQQIVTQIKQSKNQLNASGQRLSDGTSEAVSSITQIIANIESVHNRISTQSESVNNVADIVTQISDSIANLDSLIENQSAGVSQASTAVEEMMGNISAVNKSVDKMASSFEDLTSNAQTGFSKQQDVNDRIKQIENQSEMLHEANLAISSIAEQTNLLAMNAAIEAAHAGEAGKGFSVVADEIRKLSETSSAQSKTIGEQLDSIQESITEVVSASTEASDAFSAVSNKIKETDQIVMQIKAAMEEQNSGSKQIGDALRNMNESASDVLSASKEMAANSKVIINEIHSLQNSSREMNQSMEEMAVGARKINETSNALGEISTEVASSIGQIGSQIDLFTV
ncbi:MAG: cache domain-containing protein [Treponema sp.]|nr:cache domain-containing protein [Treponema sp.]